MLSDLTHYLQSSHLIYAWHEESNPTGSLKDKMVGFALERAKKNGELKEGVPVVEASSGNTGAALAYAARELGHLVHIFVSEAVSIDKKDALRSYGATVHEISVSAGPQSEIRSAQEFADQHEFYFFNQFENPYHIEGYRHALVPPLLRALEKQNILIDTFVGGVGSGASVRAIGEALRTINSELRILAVLPQSFPSAIEGLHPAHLSPVGEFPLWAARENGFESETILVDDEQALSQAVHLHHYGFEVGPASGAVVSVAKGPKALGNTLVVFTDHKNKYTQKFQEWREKLKEGHGEA